MAQVGIAGLSASPPQEPRVALGVRTPAQVTAEFESKRSADSASQYIQQPVMDALARHVHEAYEANKTFRAEEMDNILLEDLRQANGKYDPDKLADLKRSNDPVLFWNTTGEKCNGALAWIMDVINFDNGKPFTLDPTPIPDLPKEAEDKIAEQVMIDVQAYLSDGNDLSLTVINRYAAMMRDKVDAELLAEAKTRAKRMELQIYDQMVEGGWHRCFEDFLYNLVWAPVAVIKGPVMRRVTVIEYRPGPFGMVPVVTSKIKPTFKSVSPFDLYPSREAVDINDGELCERLKIAPIQLETMLGVTGFQDRAIEKILAGYRQGGYRDTNNTDAERAELERKGSVMPDTRDYIEGVEYWGAVPGHLLKEKGVTKDAAGKPLYDLKMYEANVILVKNDVIFAAVNPELTGKRPYVKTSWRKLPGAWWGQGVPRIMRELQQVINATMRSLCKDMARSVGYQTIYNDLSRLAPGEVITESFPDKIHQFTNPGRISEKPMDFWQPTSQAATLLNVYQTFKPEGDNLTGIPAYAYGNAQSADQGRTMGGLQILMTNAARGIKMVLSRIDKDIYRDMVEKMFHFNMQFSDREDIKGDVMIQCSGALSQIVNEQNSQRLMQFLTATANPMDAAIVGPEERASAYREFVKTLQLPKDALVKSDESIRKEIELAKAEQAEQEKQAGQSGLPQQVQAQE